MEQSDLRFSLAFSIVASQSLATLVASVLLLFWLGWIEAFSAFLGGVVCVIPNAYFAHRIRRSAQSDPMAMTIRLFTGEVAKWILSALLFLFIFTKVEEVNGIFLFGSFLVLQSFNLLVPLIAQQVSPSPAGGQKCL